MPPQNVGPATGTTSRYFSKNKRKAPSPEGSPLQYKSARDAKKRRVDQSPTKSKASSTTAAETPPGRSRFFVKSAPPAPASPSPDPTPSSSGSQHDWDANEEDEDDGAHDLPFAPLCPAWVEEFFEAYAYSPSKRVQKQNTANGEDEVPPSCTAVEDPRETEASKRQTSGEKLHSRRLSVEVAVPTLESLGIVEEPRGTTDPSPDPAPIQREDMPEWLSAGVPVRANRLLWDYSGTTFESEVQAILEVPCVYSRVCTFPDVPGIIRGRWLHWFPDLASRFATTSFYCTSWNPFGYGDELDEVTLNQPVPDPNATCNCTSWQQHMHATKPRLIQGAFHSTTFYALLTLLTRREGGWRHLETHRCSHPAEQDGWDQGNTRASRAFGEVAWPRIPCQWYVMARLSVRTSYNVICSYRCRGVCRCRVLGPAVKAV